MKKLWLVITTTYRRRVRSGTFLFLTFGLPLVMVAASAIPILMMQDDALPTVGVVDQAGLVQSYTSIQMEAGDLEFIAYPDMTAARAALAAGEIGGTLLIPADYPFGERVTYHADKRPGEALEEGLRRFMRRCILGEDGDWLAERLESPSAVIYKELTSGEVVPWGPGLLIHFIAPAVLSLLFALAVFTGASQLGSIMVREKEQRALEIVLTSLSPRQLVAGKIAGMTLLSMTQIAIWLLGGVIAVLLISQGSFSLSDVSVPWNAIGWSLLLGVPAYFLYATLAAGAGIIAGDSQQAQQLSGYLGMGIFVPFWMSMLLVSHPNGALAVGLTLFPLSAPVTAMVRMALTEVPAWQLWTAASGVLLSLVVVLAFVARMFRASMLLYGQAIRPRAIWRAMRDA